MAEGGGNNEKVELDEDNYVEETEDDAENEIEEDPEEVEVEEEEDVGDGNNEENAKEEHEDMKNGDNQDDKSLEWDREHNVNDNNPPEDHQKTTQPIDEEEKEKRAELLALPPHGSEVFIGGLPKDISEEDLRDLCEPIGDIYEMRLVKDKGTGESKGFAFVAYKSKAVTQKAIDELHNKEFKGKTIRCTVSETKNRLFIGNVSKHLTENEFRKIIDDVGPGAEVIELMKDPQAPTRNRGFAFILYYNNACADYSRQKMLDPNFKLGGNTPTVSWADPKSAPDQSSAASQVKALYVKNIPENTSTEKLKEIFQRHGEVTKVVMPPGKTGKRNFGFIHYAERSSALKAVRDNEKYEIDGQMLEVVLAKPQTERKADVPYVYGAGVYPSPVLPPAFGGFPASPYGMGGGFGAAASFQQPMIYGRGPMPSGMNMVPMVLPDGQIGYVLQQPGVQVAQPRPRRYDRSNGPHGHGRAGNRGDDGSRSRRCRPY